MKRDRSGFTILELLAAIAVASALVLLCAVIMRTGMNQHQGLSSELALEREVNLLVEQLTHDLTVSHPRSWHQSQSSDSWESGWYVLQPRSAQSGNSAVGDLCAVTYALSDSRLKLGPGDVFPCVVRVQRDSREVFTAIANRQEELLWSIEGEGEPLAQGVLVFELQPVCIDESGLWKPWQPELRVMPQAVELQLVVASAELQARLRTQEDWDLARTDMDLLKGPMVRGVRTRIHLGADAH